MALHRPIHLLPVLRRWFNLDYEVTRAFMAPCAGLCSLAYLVFHWIDQAQGFVDYLPMRVLAVLVPLGVAFFPKAGKLPWYLILYFEFAVMWSLPVVQTFLAFLNAPHPYWIAANVFWALLIGIFTKALWVPVHMLAGPALGLAVYGAVFGPPDPARVEAYLTLQPLVIMTALIAAAIKIALEVMQKKSLALAEVHARAEEAERRESEITLANKELRRRENVIKRFVRPALLDELAEGADPTEFMPIKREQAILFCDIRDFTRLTEVLEPFQKQAFLNQYFSMMTNPIIENGGEVDKIMGDCVMGVFPDGNSAVRAATDMRLQLQAFNQRMYLHGRPKIRNGTGIAKGEVMLGNFGSYEKLDRTVIGEAVNIAARLESKTKMYNLEVVVTEDVVLDLPAEFRHYRWIDLVQVKGSTRHVKLYEVYAHQPPEVRRYKDATRELLEKALSVYFGKGFKDAARMFRALREAVPPHRHDPEQPMDTLIDYYIARCDSWLDDSRSSLDIIQKWEGVHVFFEK